MNPSLSTKDFSRLGWLALALFLRPAPAHSEPAACKSDVLLYCQNEPKEARDACLLGNWGHVSRTCRAALADSSKDPCREVISGHCLDTGPKTALGDCIDANLAQASPACKEKTATEPCAAARNRFCKTAKRGKESITCLLNHMEDIPLVCLDSLKLSPNWVKPCRQDLARFCPDAQTGPAQRSCLTAKLDQLSPLCRKLTIRTDHDRSCDGDVAKLCKNVLSAQKRPCLLKQSAKLSQPCLQLLRSTPSPTKGAVEGDDGRQH